MGTGAGGTSFSRGAEGAIFSTGTEGGFTTTGVFGTATFGFTGADLTGDGSERIGAVGVSGEAPADDAACAEAGITAAGLRTAPAR